MVLEGIPTDGSIVGFLAVTTVKHAIVEWLIGETVKVNLEEVPDRWSRAAYSLPEAVQ